MRKGGKTGGSGNKNWFVDVKRHGRRNRLGKLEMGKSVVGNRNVTGKRVTGGGSHRKGGKKGGGYGSTGGGGRITVSGVYYMTTTIASQSPSSIFLDPAIIPRLTMIGAGYQNFRFTFLKIKLLPINVTTASTDYWVMGYSSDVSSNISSIVSVQQVSECTPSALQSVSVLTTETVANGIGPNTLWLGKKILLDSGSLKWWKVVGDTGTNAWENFQGQLLIYNAFTSATTYKFWVSYSCQFTSPINSVITQCPFPPSLAEMNQARLTLLARRVAAQQDIPLDEAVLEVQLQDRAKEKAKIEG